jgi:hypothetical protein
MIAPEPIPNPAAAELVNVRVQYAPGKFTDIDLPRESVGSYGYVKTVLMADGTVVPLWKTWSGTMKVGRDLPAKLGLDVHVDTIRCLIHAGIVKAGKFAPSCTLVDVDSLIKHLVAVMKDSAAVWTDEKQLAYSEAWKELHGRSSGMTRRAKRKRHKKTRPQIPPPPDKKAQAVIPVILPAADPMQPDLFPL